MKAKEVLKLLKVTRPTLTSYVKTGKLSVIKLPNGSYEYNDDDVYKLAGLTYERKNVIYSRVSTSKQKQDLNNQEQTLINYCNNNGIKIHHSYKEIGSALNFDRKEFQSLLNQIITYQIKTVYITYKDRLSRISFNMFKELFSQFNCQIIVINDIDDKQTIEKEIFEEIISLLHSFSMKLYSKRKQNKLNLIKADLENEINS